MQLGVALQLAQPQYVLVQLLVQLGVAFQLVLPQYAAVPLVEQRYALAQPLELLDVLLLL